MKKQFIAKLLVLCMAISMLPMAVFAENAPASESIEDGQYTIRLDTAANTTDGKVTANALYAIDEDTEPGRTPISDGAALTSEGASIPANAIGVEIVATAKEGYVVDAAESTYTIDGDDPVPFGTENEKSLTVTVNKVDNIVVKPVFVAATTDDDNNGGGGSSGGSSSGGSDKVDVAKPDTDSAGGTTTVEVGVDNKTSGNTTTATVSKKDMDKAVKSAVDAAAKAGTAPAIVVKVKTSAKTAAVNTVLPAKSLETLGKTAGATLKITSDVVDMHLDTASIAALAEQAGGSNVTLGMKPVQASELSSAQQAAVKGATVIDISITSGGKQITSFNGGKLSVAVAYTLPSGVAAADVQVYYLTDKGILQSHETSYADGKVTFITTHLSKYVIGTKDMSGMTFEDVAAGQYYYDAVAWAVSNQITNGVSATLFAPDQNCTRAQIVTFLWRSAGSPEPASATNPFTDVDSSAYYYKAVLWAVEKGITKGTTDTTFSPDDTCTRAQAVAFLYRSVGSPDASGVGGFTDVPADAYYNSAVAWAVKSNITNGTSETTFSPDNTCTRAQIVTFLYRNVL